jgi:hypothetical protein
MKDEYRSQINVMRRRGAQRNCLGFGNGVEVALLYVLPGLAY